MHILITGGAGYIGSHTAKAVARAGHTPVVYDSLERGHRWAVRWGPLVEADLASAETLRRTIEQHAIDAVIHFAAFIAVGESMNRPGLYLHNNFVNTLNVLEAMRATGVSRIVFSSTAATYGDPLQVPIPEDHPKRPVSPYGESKLMVERALHWYGEIHGLRSVALRYFNAAGADPQGEIGEVHDPETHLIPLALAAANGDLAQLQIYGSDYETPDGTAVRDYIHVADLAAAHLKALDYLAGGGASAALNLGTGEGVSVREVIRATEEITGRPIPVRESARRPGDAPILVADPSQARKTLDWEPRHSSLEEIVGTAWEWYRKKPVR
jgi:UDP-glucose-4-epimerase GalE